MSSNRIPPAGTIINSYGDLLRARERDGQLQTKPLADGTYRVLHRATKDENVREFFRGLNPLRFKHTREVLKSQNPGKGLIAPLTAIVDCFISPVATFKNLYDAAVHATKIKSDE